MDPTTTAGFFLALSSSSESSETSQLSLTSSSLASSSAKRPFLGTTAGMGGAGAVVGFLVSSSDDASARS